MMMHGSDHYCDVRWQCVVGCVMEAAMMTVAAAVDVDDDGTVRLGPFGTSSGPV